MMSLKLAAYKIIYICKCVFVFTQEKMKHKNPVEESQALPLTPAHKLDIPSRGSHCFTMFKRIKPSLPLQQGALAMRTGFGV